MDRRQFVAGAGSLVALGVSGALRRALAGAAPAPPPSGATERLNALFDAFMDERFSKNPNQLTQLGLDKGKYAWARAKLTDASLERVHGFKRENALRLERLKAFDRSVLSGTDLSNYDTVAYSMETLALNQPFEYGDANPGRPYVVSQLTGA